MESCFHDNFRLRYRTQNPRCIVIICQAVMLNRLLRKEMTDTGNRHIIMLNG